MLVVYGDRGLTCRIWQGNNSDAEDLGNTRATFGGGTSDCGSNGEGGAAAGPFPGPIR